MSKEFEIARLLVIQAYRAGWVDDAARAYAWASRTSPLNPDDLEEAFQDDFKTDHTVTSAVLKHIDENWRAGSLISFYDLEQHFGAMNGGPGTVGRVQLIDICRMAFIGRLFDQATWDALTKPGCGPIESQGIAVPFEKSEIYV